MRSGTAPDRAIVRADLLAASAFSAVLLSANVGYWTAPTNDYYLRGEDRGALLSCLAAMALVTAFAYAILRGLRRHPRWRRFAFPLALVATLFALDRLRVAVGLAMPASSAGRVAVVLAAVTAALMLARLSNAGRLLHTGFRWASALTVLFALTLVRAYIVRPSIAPERVSERVARKPIVVWAILDELDEGWLFDHRPAGLTLPAFDALAAESLVCRNVKRPGPETLYSLPAFTLGHEIQESTVADRDDLNLTLEDGRRIRWSQADTVFDAMRAMGRTTVIEGFYHNYPAVFGKKVDGVRTSIYPVTTFAGTFEDQFLRLLPGLVREALLERLGSFSAVNRDGAVQHRARLAGQIDSVRRTISRQRADFVFFHGMVPHAPFYRAKGEGTVEPVSGLEGYLDNLRHADDALATLVRTLRSSGAWDDATLLVTSDHNFRHSLRGMPLNDLVPLILKLPHRAEPLRLDAPVRAVDERWLLEAIVRGEVRTPKDAAEFLVSKARR